jgi:hypothetical protein
MGLYSALSQDGKLMVEDIPQWCGGCALAKWVGLYPACLALSGGVIGWGHSVSRPLLSQPPVFMLLCRGAVISGVFLLSFAVSCVNLSMLSLILSFSLSFSLSFLLYFFLSEDLSPRTMPQDYLA